MKKVLFLLFIAMSSGLAADWASAEDNPVEEREISLYSDVKALRIGDVLSVIISESNSATNNARTNTNNQNKTNAEGEATTGALKGLFPGVGGSMDVSNQYNG